MPTAKAASLFSKTNMALVTALGMLLGLLVSRSMLSVCIILFGLGMLYNVNPKRWFSQKWWLLGIAWIAMYAISYFWTADKHSWHERLDIKLPVLLLPLAFGFLPAFSIRQLRIYTFISALLLLGSTAYTFYFLFQTPGYYAVAYRYSHFLPTLAEDDHISYSVCIATSVIWYFYIWTRLNKSLKAFIGFAIVFLIIFLHILAARSGLVMLYLFAFAYCVYIALRRSRLLGFGIIAGLILIAVLSIRFVPTLSQRMDYLKYSFESYQKGDRTGWYGDVGRAMSYRLAIRGIKEHPLAGVGAGDILDEMKKLYDEVYPDVGDANRLFPHNQFLVVAFGCGIPAMLLFIIWLCAPLALVKRGREGLFLLFTWLVLLVPLMIEPFLEAQLCLFVYLFPLLWQRHMVWHPPAGAEANKQNRQ